MKIKFLYKASVLATSLLLFLSSCSDGFLNSDSSDVVPGSEIPDSEKESTADKLLKGLYYAVFNSQYRASHDDFSIRAMMFASDMMTEDVPMSGSNWFVYDYENDNRGTTYRRTNSTWLQNYNMISVANDVISKLESAADLQNLTDDQKQILGQAYAIRGYLYYILINFYQQPYAVAKDKPGVPILTDKITKAGRNTVGEVYESLLSDLNTGYNYLKGLGKGDDATTLNEFSVAGMLARVYCFVNDEPNQWKKVADFADIATKGTNPATKDQLLSKFNTLDQVDALWGSKITSETYTGYASFMSNMDSYTVGYARGNPKMIFNKLYDKIATDDVRKEWFAANDFSIGKDKLPKYTQLKFKDSGGFASDYIYMRASEFYFVAAEAYMKLNNEAKAKEYLEDVMSVRIPNYSASNYSGNALLEEIQLQKRIETWGEGVRLYDMKWRGEAMDRNYIVKVGGKDENITNHDIALKMTLSPNPVEWVYQIPIKEMDNNPEIKEQNP